MPKNQRKIDILGLSWLPRVRKAVITIIRASSFRGGAEIAALCLLAFLSQLRRGGWGLFELNAADALRVKIPFVWGAAK